MRACCIIVTFNNQKDIEPLIESLQKDGWDSEDILYFVDNASTDGTAHIIAQKIKNIRTWHLITNKKNLGFSSANNEGMRIARSTYSDIGIWVFLNPDIIVSPKWYEPLKQYLIHSNKIIVTPILYHKDGSINTAGCELHWLGFGFMRDYKALIKTPHTTEVFYPSGACCALREADALQLSYPKNGNLWWDDLFLYHEDVELGWRARIRGFSVVAIPSGHCIHTHMFHPKGERNAHKFYFIERNRLIINFLFWKKRTLVLLAPFFLLTELILFFFPGFIGRVYTRYTILRDAWKIIFSDTFMARRKWIQELHWISDKSIFLKMSPTITHQEVMSPFLRFANVVSQVLFRCLASVIRW